MGWDSRIELQRGYAQSWNVRYFVWVTDALSNSLRQADGEIQPALLVQPGPTMGVGQHIWRAGSTPSWMLGPVRRTGAARWRGEQASFS